MKKEWHRKPRSVPVFTLRIDNPMGRTSQLIICQPLQHITHVDDNLIRQRGYTYPLVLPGKYFEPVGARTNQQSDQINIFMLFGANSTFWFHSNGRIMNTTK